VTSTETPEKVDDRITDYQADLAKARNRFDTITQWHIEAMMAVPELPLPYVDANTVYCNVEDEDGKIDVPATKSLLRKVSKFALSKGYEVKKDYSYDFSVKVILKDEYPRISVSYSVDRAAVCTKRVVDTKVVPARTIPEKIEEVVEWDCGTLLGD
jgi:hypothetical protein